MTIKNVLTIDVEDYFHVAALAKSISVSEWDNIASRVEKNTHSLLAQFAKYNVKATFFILGWIAERYPGLVKEIETCGHEIASHGYSHQLIYSQSPEVFKKETFESKKLLEDIIGKPIKGYRAASYSITNRSLWALDILAEAGFTYDSSIFPIRHDNYGIPGSPTEPHILKTPNGEQLIEYPLSTYKLIGQTVPVAGGGYFRLYPYWLSKYFYKNLNRTSKSFVFYLHPWEIDPEQAGRECPGRAGKDWRFAEQPRIKASWFSEFRHYNNLDKCEKRLNKLLNDFDFITMDEKLEELGLYSERQDVSI